MMYVVMRVVEWDILVMFEWVRKIDELNVVDNVF